MGGDVTGGMGAGVLGSLVWLENAIAVGWLATEPVMRLAEPTLCKAFRSRTISP